MTDPTPQTDENVSPRPRIDTFDMGYTLDALLEVMGPGARMWDAPTIARRLLTEGGYCIRRLGEAEAAPALDVERLALYMHQARTSNDELIFDMDEARRRAQIVAARLAHPDSDGDTR